MIINIKQYECKSNNSNESNSNKSSNNSGPSCLTDNYSVVTQTQAYPAGIQSEIVQTISRQGLSGTRKKNMQMFPVTGPGPGRGQGAVATLVREATNISFDVADVCSERLSRAVIDNDVNVIRELHKSGSESLQDTLQAIVKSDNDQLLKSFVETIEVTDGAIREHGNPINSPVLRYAIKKSALKCVLALMRVGVDTECVKEDLIITAIDKTDVEMLRKLLSTTTFQDCEKFALLAARHGNAEALDTILQLKPLSSKAKDWIVIESPQQ